MNNDFINQDIQDIIIERDGYKEQVEEKDKEIDRLNKQLKWDYKEINRLRNIINELEKILQEDFENNRNYYDYPRIYLDKLKELKEKE